MVPTQKLPIIMRIFTYRSSEEFCTRCSSITMERYRHLIEWILPMLIHPIFNSLINYAWYLTMMKYSTFQKEYHLGQEAANSSYNNDHNRIMDGWTELNPNFVGTDSLQNITAIAATPSAQNKVYYGTDKENYIESIMLLSSIPLIRS